MPRRLLTLPFACLLAAALAAQARVATHYFYWYRHPGEHFPVLPGSEEHLHHFPEPEKVSYLDPDWHEAQLRDMAACGIDFALPVYWGAPGAYERRNLRFSRDGLAPMVAALERLEARGEQRVAFGLFYDTSTLLNDVRGALPRGGRADLTEDAGKALFCGTVVEYFERIPPRFWARVGGRALVVLYGAGFAARWDATLGPALRAAFGRRFPGEDVFLVADASWGQIGQDRQTAWGAALHGPMLLPGVAQIGPGYDDSPVPGRRTPRREREDGDFYRWSWRRALLAKPELVLIETWNEMHEGTEICATKETGRAYLDLTREWIQKLKQGGDPGPEIALRHPEPLPRPDPSWGREAKGATSVRAAYESELPLRRGLREIPWEDGPIAVRDGRLMPESDRRPTYVYFQVADVWRFDADVDLMLEVAVDALPDGAAPQVEFDSRDAMATLAGSYTRAAPATETTSGATTTLRYTLPRARFANRQNGSADFRLVVTRPGVRIRSVTLTARDSGEPKR